MPHRWITRPPMHHAVHRTPYRVNDGIAINVFRRHAVNTHPGTDVINAINRRMIQRTNHDRPFRAILYFGNSDVIGPSHRLAQATAKAQTLLYNGI